ncbi:MAG: hypothetical protein GC180_08275 [Bacteroidetes bacterium]|nr:hypothetical protein [Bacteroidota bacterium]
MRKFSFWLFLFFLILLAGIASFGMSFLQFAYFTDELNIELLILGVAVFVLPLGWYLGKSWGKKDTQERALARQTNLAQLLSKREEDVFYEVCKGKTNQQIADTLHISLATVKSHVSNILSKLDLERRSQIILFQQEYGGNNTPTSV